jgi:hypothetical protein
MKLTLTLFVLSLASGCTGRIGGEIEGDTPAGGGPIPGQTGGPPTGGTSGGSQPGQTGQPPSTDPGDPSAAGVMPLRRLTIREYDSTVRDLLGDTTAPARQFPDDRDDTFAFRRAGAVAVQDAKLLRGAAEALAAAAARNLGTILPCDPAAAGEAACAGQFVRAFGLRAFRRPLTTAEEGRLVALYTTGRGTLKLGFAEAIGLVIEGLLQAPAFLYHWEAPAAPAIHEGKVLRLGHYEVASRLSYFLWGSMPDRPLFDAAAAGKLGTTAEVEAQARRLLADPRARETVAAFFEEWLALDTLADKAKDPKVYPQYDDALRAAMTAETRAFVANVVFEGDGRWGSLLGGGFSFLNQALGGVYGLAVTGPDLRRTDLNRTQRAGLLTQPAFLALTGAADGSHPVRRGKALYEKLLCRELPPPPANVPPAKPASSGGTTRQRFAEHDTNDCARACHTLIDPLGFAFEGYDGIGRYRTSDNGQPVDASGAVPLDGADRSFSDAVGLSAVLGASAEVRRCFTTQWVRFALARRETEADQASLVGAAAAFARPEATVRDLMIAVATMRSFRYRSPSPGEVSP